MSDDPYNLVIEEALRLEPELGLSGGFIEALKNEDDWSFIIKAHALIEAAVTHALVVRTGLENSAEFFSHLELSASRTGKLALAKSIDLLDEDERRFVRALSELRNKFVHDVKNVQTTLIKYFESVSKDKRKELAISFCSKAFRNDFTVQQAIEWLTTQPKEAIWTSTVFILFVLRMQANIARAERQSIEHQRDYATLAKEVFQKK